MARVNVCLGQSNGHGEPQTTMVSWWPRPPAVAASGINMGWWSQTWENVYQRRLDQVQRSGAILSNHDNWKSNLKNERTGARYIGGAERCAARVLEALLP